MSNACTIRTVATGHFATSPNDCPTVASLAAAKELVADKPDPWGTAYKISCVDPNAPSEAGDEVTVISAGPDRMMATADDVVANQSACDPFKTR